MIILYKSASEFIDFIETKKNFLLDRSDYYIQDQIEDMIADMEEDLKLLGNSSGDLCITKKDKQIKKLQEDLYCINNSCEIYYTYLNDCILIGFK